MALVKCPDCEKTVSSRVEMCPFCGCPSKFFISNEDDKTIKNVEQEKKKDITNVGIKEYHIAGRVIRTTQEDENTAYFTKMYQKIASDCCEKFKNKLDGMISVEEMLNKTNELVERYLDYALEQTIYYFRNHGIYSLDKTLFIQKYCTGFEAWDAAYESIYEKYAQIVGKEAELKEYRELRKQSRGRVVGGGFTFKGYVKGVVQAGAINMVTGLAHDFVNSIGNSITESATQNKLKKLYNNSNTWNTLINGLYDSIMHLQIDMMNALNRESNIKCKINTSENVSRSNALVRAAGNQPTEKNISIFVEALEYNLYNADAYIGLTKCLPKESSEIEKLAEHFGVDLTYAKVINIVKQMNKVDELLVQMQVSNKQPYSNILLLKELYGEWKEIVFASGWNQEELNLYIKGYNDRVKEVEDAFCMIDGNGFANKELTMQVAKEIEEFYQSIAEVNIQNEETLVNIKNTLSKYELINKYYPTFLAEKLEKKIKLKDVKNLPPELANICWQPNVSKNIQESIYLKGLSKEFDRKKERLCKAIKELEGQELICIIFITGKNGFVISDKKICQFEFALLSFKDKIEKLEVWDIKNFESITQEKQSVKIVTTDPNLGKKKFTYVHCSVPEEDVAVYTKLIKHCVLFMQNK